jgi:hypothetical protein
LADYDDEAGCFGPEDLPGTPGALGGGPDQPPGGPGGTHDRKDAELTDSNYEAGCCYDYGAGSYGQADSNNNNTCLQTDSWSQPELMSRSRSERKATPPPRGQETRPPELCCKASAISDLPLESVRDLV